MTDGEQKQVTSMSEERVMVITGASSGLGAASAEHFAAKGYRIVLGYIVDDEAETVHEAISSQVGADRVIKCKADVANREQVRAMFDDAIEAFGRVDILINFAGINRDAPFTELTDDMWDSVVAAHLRGTFVCSQEFVFHNPDRPGCIINLGAACGQVGRKNGANFCSAKGGIFALTKCMAQELGPRIRVNALLPNAVKTREVMERYDLEDEVGLAKEVGTMPMGRLGEVGDVTHMLDAIIGAEFSTGATFLANGGQYMQ